MSSKHAAPPPRDPSQDSTDAIDAEGFAEFVALLDPTEVPDAVRARLLEAVQPEGRLASHADAVASLLHVDRATAVRLLDEAGTLASYLPGPFPGVTLFHVEGGAEVASAITGFVRIAGGGSFPRHEHLGDETVLVVSGSMLESETGRIYRAGELARAPRGSAHTSVARPGPDLVYLAVLFEGLRVGDDELREGDRRL